MPKSTLELPINPRLPRNFSNTPNEARPASHMRWWDRPYIETFTVDEMCGDDEARRQKWLASWPSGTRYDVRCLDGGCHDRPTCWGMFATLDEAKNCIAWRHGG